jgi:hemerythrin superfamily protein
MWCSIGDEGGRVADGFALLQDQHREIERLFDRYAQTADDAVAREVCDLVTLHSQTEEQALYPELRRIVDDGDDLADRAEAEHGAIRTLVARVYDSPPDDLRPLIDELAREVARHVQFEESRIFPDMREVGVDADALARRLHAAAGEASSRSSGEVG